MEETTPFELDALLVFGKVVECRSLSRAADALGLPKSTVSRKLSRLERDLGIKLLRRNTHQISVTEIGEKIYGHSQKVLSEANEVRALVEGSKQEPIGQLKVAIPMFLGVDYAADVGAAFLSRYPQSRLDIRLVDSAMHPIKDGFDVAFGPGPLQDSTLIGRKVFSLHPFLCASAEFLDSLPHPLTVPAQLSKLPFIDCAAWGTARKLMVSKGRRQSELSPMIRARANNFQVCKQYLLQGLGVGIMPNQIICTSELKRGSIVPVLPDWKLEKLDVYMMYPFKLSFSSLITAFHGVALEIISRNSARS